MSENAKAIWEQSGHKLGEAERLLAEGLYRQLIYGKGDLSWIGSIMRAFQVHAELIDLDVETGLRGEIDSSARRNPLDEIGELSEIVRSFRR